MMWEGRDDGGEGWGDLRVKGQDGGMVYVYMQCVYSMVYVW